jgi:hypothetical protein
MIPMMMNAQTYSTLWKQVSEAEERDLPQTEQKLLRQIAEKAEAEGDYAQLLKAELQEARALCNVSPDSLAPSVERLKMREQQAKDNVLQAVYCCVLAYVYQHNSILDEDNYKQIATDYYTRALAHPDLLAAVKTATYETIIDKGSDSRLFDDDLLSVIGYEARRFDILSDYYVKTGNRRAALLTSLELLKQQQPGEMEQLNKSKYLQRVDSLINEYADLPEAGEAAIERYDYMKRRTNATAAEKMLYLNEAIGRWGSWQRMNVLRNCQRDLTPLSFNINVADGVTIPGKEQVARLTNLRGINSITLRFYRVDIDAEVPYDPERNDDYIKLKKRLTPLPMTCTHNYVGKTAYEVFEDSMTIPALPVGVYMLEAETTPATKVARQLLYVSGVRLISQPMPDRMVRFVAVDAVSGQPLPDTKLELTSYTGYYSEKKDYTLKTDERGEAVYTQREKERSHTVFATTADDRYCPTINQRGEYNYYANDKESSTVRVYTDRHIYRPGQTVHVAAICYTTRNVIETQVDADKEVTLQLRDANGQVVGEKKVTTDEYGTCSAEFAIPTQGLTGTFNVHADVANSASTSESINVEEYKRPAFEVDIPAVRMNYEDGDTVVVKGHARSYAGVPVQGARVKYKVVRRRAFWWMNYFRYWDQLYIGHGTDDVDLGEGETMTDGSGTFNVDVPIVVPKTRYPMFYNFVVTADVTDQAGETHHGSCALPMGNRPKAFSCTLPEQVLNDEETSMSFHQQNAAGIELDAQVRYRFDNTGRWQEAKTNTLIQLPKMKSGRHTLQAICENDTVDHTFTVFALDDTQPATETADWFYVSKHRFPNDGTPVTVQVGSSDKDVHILYGIFAGNKLLESGAADRSNELLNRKFTYQEEYGNGLLITFAWVKNGIVYRHSTTIQRPLPEKRMKLQWKTFRNRLTPGQEEEWILTITRPDGTPSPSGKAGDGAQLIATLYDKSLDQLAQHDWSLNPTPWLSTPSTYWQYGSWDSVSLSGYKHQGNLNVNKLDFSEFNHSLYPTRWVFRRRFTRANGSRGEVLEDAIGYMAASKSASPVLEEARVFDVVEQMPSFNAAAADENAVETEEAIGSNQQPVPQVRENLSETAFFYPQLTTDDNGHVAIKFTLPESLTTWRFMGLAHTKDMMYGTLTDEAIARKEVMIQPNMPRFVRQGDRATIVARVINMSDTDISGTARLLLLDAETEKVVAQAALPVTVEAPSTSGKAGDEASTVAVSFPVEPREKWPSLLIARVTIEAQAATRSNVQLSDGEQHYLPILPNRDHVTVTVPFTQHEPGTKTIDLQKLIPDDATQAKLTVEYTNNPAWLMIQALPAIGHPHDDCALCQAASYYANALGLNIIAQNPQAKEVFEQWSSELENGKMKNENSAAPDHTAQSNSQFSTLNSQLQKNQELKDLLLNETPWVIDADREQEQRQRLADFFDKDLMDQRLSSAVDKLNDLQQRDGSWSWWPGMRGSWYMTVNISQMLVRLNTMMGIENGKMKTENSAAPASVQSSIFNGQWSKMLDKAFKFMGNEAIDIVKEIKRMEKEYGIKPTFPNHTTLEWLYICALDGRKLPSKVQEANDFLTNLLKKEIKNQSIYDKAMTAIILNNKTYIKSLKEYTVYREDMGRYYDTDRALYSWRDYRIPTQVAAIEALQHLTPDDTQTIEEMQRWLLQEKRTQAWDTPVNSVEAVYAFLNGRSQLLSTDAPLSTLTIDGQPLSASSVAGGIATDSQPTAGLGYVKTAMPADGKRTFTAKKTSQGTSWGAVYAQFLQPTATIDNQQSGIKVTRELFIENPKLKNEDSAAPAQTAAASSTLYTQHSKLSIGDRVTVRITIEADRDYDFVQVVDKRAACMEPVKQRSGYIYGRGTIGGGFYCAPRDCSTNYYYDCLSKGKHIIETEYYIDRAGTYETGICTASCAYSPEFRGMTGSTTITVEP